MGFMTVTDKQGHGCLINVSLISFIDVDRCLVYVGDFHFYLSPASIEQLVNTIHKVHPRSERHI